MYFGFIVFIALIWYSFSAVKGEGDEKMKKKGFVKVSENSRPDLGVMVKLQAKAGAIPKSKYPSKITRGTGIDVMPQEYALFEVDDELVWIPRSSGYRILAFNQGNYYKPNPNQAIKLFYTKGETKFKTQYEI